MRHEEKMLNILDRFCKANALTPMSADEMVYELGLEAISPFISVSREKKIRTQVAWLERYIYIWDSVETEHWVLFNRSAA